MSPESAQNQLLLVEIKGKPVYLELEVRSTDFENHGHVKDCRYISKGKFRGRRLAKLKGTNDDWPVAVLCWVNDHKDQGHELKNRVRGLEIIELQSLLRSGKKIGVA